MQNYALMSHGIHFDKWQRKKNIATVRQPLKYDPKRPGN